MALACPIDAGIPSSFISHPVPRAKRRAAATFADPCTGARKTDYASGADSPRGIDRGQSIGARVPLYLSHAVSGMHAAGRAK